MRISPAAVFAVALAGFVQPSTALAWDAEAHKSILDVALLLSPAAAARIPAEYRDELLKEMQVPDSRDTLCRYHRGPAARVDPFVEAERELAFLTQAGAPPRPYPRAKSMGRYLHWVADSVVPEPIASGRVCEVLDFWANKDFLVFREKAPLAASLARELRARAEAVAWADDGPGALPPVFRQVVNATIDALLRLPAIPGAPVGPEEGPVLFIVNRIDTGLSGMRSNLVYYEMSYDVGGGLYVDDAGIAEIRSGGQGEKKADLMQRQRLQIAEQSSRKNPGGGVSIRAIVFNNLKVASCDVAIQGGARWSVPLGGSIPPGGLLPATFDVPAGVDLRALTLRSRNSGCPATIAAGAVRTERRFVLGNTGIAPRLKAEEGSISLAGGTARPSTVARSQSLSSTAEAVVRREGTSPGDENGVIVVGVGKPADYGLGAPVEVLAMQVAATPFEWRVRVSVRNAVETPRRQVRLVVARVDGGGTADGDSESIWVDVRKLAAGETKTFDLTHKPRKAAVPKGLRLVDVRASS